MVFNLLRRPYVLLLSGLIAIGLTVCKPTQCLTVSGQQRMADCEFVIDKLTITGADPVLTNVPRLSKKGVTLNPNQAQEGDVISSPSYPLRWFTFTLNLTIRRVALPAKPTGQYAVLMRFYPKGQNLSTTWGDAGTGNGGLLNGQFTRATPALNLKVGESQTIQVQLKLGLTQAGNAFKNPYSDYTIYSSLDMSLFLANPETAQYLTKHYTDMRDLSEWAVELNLVSLRR